MAVPTRSSSAPALAGNSRAWLSAVLGLLSALTMPVAVLATRYSGSYELLHAAFAIPIGLVLGAVAVTLARSARRRDEALLGRAGGLRMARTGSVLGLVGLWLAGAALVAVSVYGLLEYAASRD